MLFKLTKKESISRIVSVHHLDQRVEKEKILDVFTQVGFRRPTQGTLAIALAARVDGYKGELSRELFKQGEIFTTPSFQGGIRTILRDDWSIFNYCLRPHDESELFGMVAGLESRLTPLNCTPFELLTLIENSLTVVLHKNSLLRSHLIEHVAKEVQKSLSAADQESWLWPYEGRTLGITLVQELLPITSLSIPLILELERKRGEYRYSIAHEIVKKEGQEREFVRRYLHAYGPSDLSSFAQWAGISAPHAQRLFNTLSAKEICTVEVEGEKLLMLVEDYQKGERSLDSLRLLSRYDPLLKMKHLRFLTQSKGQFNYFFKGDEKKDLLLVDGEAVASWRIHKRERNWDLVVEEIDGGLHYVVLEEIVSEAKRVEAHLNLPLHSVHIV